MNAFTTFLSQVDKWTLRDVTLAPFRASLSSRVSATKYLLFCVEILLLMGLIACRDSGAATDNWISIFVI